MDLFGIFVFGKIGYRITQLLYPTQGKKVPIDLQLIPAINQKARQIWVKGTKFSENKSESSVLVSTNNNQQVHVHNV